MNDWNISANPRFLLLKVLRALCQFDTDNNYPLLGVILISNEGRFNTIFLLFRYISDFIATKVIAI